MQIRQHPHVLYLISGLKNLLQDIRVTLAIIFYLKGARDISAYVVIFIKQASGQLTL